MFMAAIGPTKKT
jgi:hypothetical protein